LTKQIVRSPRGGPARRRRGRLAERGILRVPSASSSRGVSGERHRPRRAAVRLAIDDAHIEPVHRLGRPRPGWRSSLSRQELRLRAVERADAPAGCAALAPRARRRRRGSVAPVDHDVRQFRRTRPAHVLAGSEVRSRGSVRSGSRNLRRGALSPSACRRLTPAQSEALCAASRAPDPAYLLRRVDVDRPRPLCHGHPPRARAA